MQPSGHRFAGYQLAVYVVAAALVAGGATFAFDQLTAPAEKLSANGAPASSGAVRQIPITRTTAADIGDPDGKLTPVYPTSPGKNLPIKDTPIKAASTTGSASGQTASPPVQAALPPAPAASPQPQMQTASTQATQIPATAQTPNSCNVAACAATYRSFRESDCTYQPFGGPRRVCEGAPGPDGTDTQASVQPQDRPISRSRYDNDLPRVRYDNDLREVERAVRRLPPPSVSNDDDDSGIAIIDSPQRRYELRRNWIAEPED